MTTSYNRDPATQAGGWRTRRMAVTARSPADRAAAMSAAEGRCEIEPAAYRMARPIALPASSVIKIAKMVVRAAVSSTITYTLIASASAFRQPGRRDSPMIVV